MEVGESRVSVVGRGGWGAVGVADWMVGVGDRGVWRWGELEVVA